MATVKAARIIKKSEEKGFVYFNKEQREELKREKFGEEQKIKEAKFYNTEIDHPLINNRVKSINSKLEAFAPPEISGETRDDLVKECKKLEVEVKQGMLPIEIMERNPTGAAWRNLRHAEVNKDKIMKWKNLRKVIDQTSEDPDLCNFEQHRPYLTQNGTSSFMADAQLPGHIAFSEEAKTRFPEDMGKNVNSAYNQITQAEDLDSDDFKHSFDEAKSKED